MSEDENKPYSGNGNQFTAVSMLKMYRQLLRDRLAKDNEIFRLLVSIPAPWIEEILPTVENHMTLASGSIFYIDTVLSLSDTDQAKVVELKKESDSAG